MSFSDLHEGILEIFAEGARRGSEFPAACHLTEIGRPLRRRSRPEKHANAAYMRRARRAEIERRLRAGERPPTVDGRGQRKKPPRLWTEVANAIGVAMLSDYEPDRTIRST